MKKLYENPKLIKEELNTDVIMLSGLGDNETEPDPLYVTLN